MTCEVPLEDQKKKGPPIWPMAWTMLALLWVGHLYYDVFDWQNFALGFLTASILVGWAVDITDNKVPDFMKPRPPSRGK